MDEEKIPSIRRGKIFFSEKISWMNEKNSHPDVEGSLIINIL